jgi:hypothetical protein
MAKRTTRAITHGDVGREETANKFARFQSVVINNQGPLQMRMGSL